MDFEAEIDSLETVLSSLNQAVESITDVPYYNYLVSEWELDIEEIQNRLDELYAIQDEQWEQEIKHQHYEYERQVL